MKREPLQFPFFVTGDREGDLMSIIKDVSDYIRQGETTGEDLGLEIEHFVINSEGMPMDFHVVSNLIAEVAGRIGARIIYMDDYPVGYQTEEYAVTLEPSCQFEISISPYSDIDRMKEVYDGTLLYVHKNEPGTLYKRQADNTIYFSTHPLDEFGWEEVEQNQLSVYRSGKLIYTGRKHDNTYHHDDARMKLIYLDHAML